MKTAYYSATSLRPIIVTLVFLHISLVTYCQIQITHTTAYRKLNPWLDNSNPAGISLNPAVTFNIVESGFNYTKGDFRLSTDASSVHHFYVGSESFLQLNKIQLYGRLNYQQKKQNERQWSAMLQPEAHLVNFGDSVSGNQTNEDYNLYGIISIPLSSNWTLGGLLDYHALASKKDTDPRNKNNQSNLLFSPGLLFSVGQCRVGGNFIYHRIIEEISYSIISTQIQEACTFYPLWFYTNENFQNGKNNNRTYLNNRYGGAFQFSIEGKNKQWEWLNEFKSMGGTEILEIFRAQGSKAGEVEQLDLSYQGFFRVRSSLHHTLKVVYDRLSKTHFNYIQSKNNSTELKPEDYGRQKRSANLRNQTSLSYALSRPSGELQDLWTFYAGCKYKREETIFLVYPIRFSQPITQLEFNTGFDYRINFRKQSLEIMTKLNYSTGHGTLLNISSENGAPMPETKMNQQQELLLHDFTIKTAENISAGLQFRYTHPIYVKYALSATAGTEYRQGLTMGNDKVNRINAMFAIGFIF